MKHLRAISWLAFFASACIASRASAACALLSVKDIQDVTGAQVEDVPFDSKPGAGGKCANFAGSDGRLYLGVSAVTSAADYKAAIASVPESVYPQREPLKGIGDEGLLMKGAGGAIRYLVARKGEKGVVLFPFGKLPDDEKLEALAKLALSR